MNLPSSAKRNSLKLGKLSSHEYGFDADLGVGLGLAISTKSWHFCKNAC